MEVLSKPGDSQWVAIGPGHLLLLRCWQPAGHSALLCYRPLILSCLQSEKTSAWDNKPALCFQEWSQC